MSTRSTLKAAPRTVSGTGPLKRLRKAGWVPAVVYGKHFANQNLQVNAKELHDLLTHSTSEHILINLEIEGGEKSLALIQDVSHDPLTGNIIHVDFHAVKEDERLHAKIPLNLVGEAVGLKQGGLLEHHLHSIDIYCLPNDLPERIIHDVTNLNVGQTVHVRDLQLPSGVSTHLADDVIVASMTEPVAVETPAPAAEQTPKKGKGKK